MSDNKAQEQIPTQPHYLRIMAQIVSYLCHPVFMPIIMAYTLYALWPNTFAGIDIKMILLIIALNAAFFPLISILLMKPLGFIGSLQMPTARERTIPLMVSMVFFFWASQTISNMAGGSLPMILKILMLGNFYGIVVLFLINIFTKISMHTAAAGGMLGILIVLQLIGPVNIMMPFFIALVIAGIIGTARLVLGAHQKGDVWLGYIIGILSQIAAFLYFKYFK